MESNDVRTASRKLLSTAEVATRLGGNSISGVHLLRKEDPAFNAIFVRLTQKRVVADAIALERFVIVKKFQTLVDRVAKR